MSLKAIMFATIGLVASMALTSYWVGKDMQRIRAREHANQSAVQPSQPQPGTANPAPGVNAGPGEGGTYDANGNPVGGAVDNGVPADQSGGYDASSDPNAATDPGYDGNGADPGTGNSVDPGAGGYDQGPASNGGSYDQGTSAAAGQAGDYSGGDGGSYGGP
jgi:hypothetical protein